MAKLIKCKTCGKLIAKSAKTCVSCGAKNRHTSMLTWIVGGIFAASLFTLILDKEQTENLSAHSAEEPPAVAVDCKKNSQREQFVAKLINDGYWEKVEYKKGLARVRVMPLFMNTATYNDKQQFISVAAAINKCKGGDVAAKLIDAMTDKEIGTYFAEFGGLKLD